MSKQLIRLTKNVSSELVTEVLELTPRERDVMSSYLRIRDSYFKLQKAEQEGDPDVPGIRSELHENYQNFVQLYSSMNSTRKGNRNTILLDVYGFMILSSVEVKINQEYQPADCLIKSARGEIEIYRTDDCTSALAHCLGVHGEIKLSVISEITDKDESEVVLELGDAIYINPSTKLWETADKYLSGNVWKKLNEAKWELQNCTEDWLIPELQRSLIAIEEVQPNKIPWTLLYDSLNFGERWVSTNFYVEFCNELMESRDIKVWHFVSSDKFKVEGAWSRKAYNDWFVRGQLSHATCNGYELLEHALENTCPKFSYTVGSGDDKVTMYDSEAIQLANQKIDDIRNEWGQWLMRLPQEKKDELVDVYNNLYNCYVIRKYNGSHLKLPGIDLSKLGKNDTPIELYYAQKDAAWMIVANRGGIIDIEVGGGKAQPLDAKLLTPKGWIEMGDVKIGDEVISIDGKATKVIGVFPQGEKDIYRIIMNDGSSTECCEDHLWTVNDTTRKFKGQPWITLSLKQILDRDGIIKLPKIGKRCKESTTINMKTFYKEMLHGECKRQKWHIPIVKPIEMDEQKTYIHPYVLGALIGDGDLSNGCVGFTKGDIEIIEKLQRLLPNNYRLNKVNGSDYSYRIIMRDRKEEGKGNKIHEEIKRLGLDKKSEGKFIPDIYKFNSKENRLALLQGLMDTDGCSEQKRNRSEGVTSSPTYSTASEQLSKDIIFLVQSLGGVARVHTKVPWFTYKGEQKQGQLSYILNISMPPDVLPFTLSRKADIHIPRTKYLPARMISDIEYVGKKQAQCIKVDHESQLYVTDDCIVTHNTMIMIIAAHEMKRIGIRTKPAILCLKANVQEIVSTYRKAYPAARVLSPGETDFEKSNRVRLFHEMKNNDWDCIIMTHDQFGKIQQSPEIEAEIAQEEVDMLDKDMGTLKKCGHQISRGMMKGLQKRRQNLSVSIKKLQAQINSKKDEDINFVDIGIDHLIVDECFPYETLILTNLGWLQIGEIVHERKEVFVLSYCEESRIFELMPVTNWLKKSLVKKLVKITHEYGEIICTDEHKLWTLESGYVKARELTPEHTILYTPVSNMWERTDTETKDVLQSDLQRVNRYKRIQVDQTSSSKRNTNYFTSMSEMWREDKKQIPEDKVLQQTMFLYDKKRGEPRKENDRQHSNVPMVWEKCSSSQEKQVLQCDMQDGTSEHFTSHQGTETRVWENISKVLSRGNKESKMFRENASQQSDAQSGNISKNGKKQTGSNISIKGRKWAINRTTNTIMSCTKSTRGEYGMGDSNQTCLGAVSIIAQSLQGGYCNTRENAVYRSGRKDTSNQEVEVFGQTQNRDIKCSRVESVKIYERKSDSGTGTGSSGDNFVYDLTVEKNHNYFADGVLVSNCHKFKNLQFITRHDRVAGLGNQQGSQRAINMLYAIRTLQKRFNDDLQVTFLSGTPISNSLTEMYLLFKYLRPRELERQNISNFDAWAAVFAKKTTDFEFSVTNQIIAKERFRHFIKVPELALFYNEIAYFRTKKMMGIDEPAMDETLTNLAPTEDQEEYIQNLILFAQTGIGEYVNRPPLTDGEQSARMLIATNLAKKMSTDMRLINPALYDDHPNNKVNVCTEKVKWFYDSSHEFKGTQLIFCDMGTPGTEGFKLYEELKMKLVGAGIPSEEVTFIHQWTERNKHELFRKMNDGELRVLIGSTDKAGTGLNVQQRVVAMHQLDIPWKPAELTQRVGRGVRPGNWGAKLYQDNKVYNFIYATERSLDNYKFTLLKNKQTFISQMKQNELQVRSIDEGSIDEQSGMNFAEYIAVLSGDTTLLEKAKIDKKLAVLEKLKSAHYREISDNKYRLGHKEERIKIVEPLTADLCRDHEQYQRLLQKDETGTKENPIHIPAIEEKLIEEQKKWEEIKKKRAGIQADTELPPEDKKVMLKDLKRQEEDIKDKPVLVGEYLMRLFKDWEPAPGQMYEKIGSLYGFDVCIERIDHREREIESDATRTIYGSNSIIHKNKYYAQHESGQGIKYNYNMGVPNFNSPRIANRQFLNSLERIEGLYETYSKELENLIRDIDGLKQMEEKPFARGEEIENLKIQSKDLERQIKEKIGGNSVTV